MIATSDRLSVVSRATKIARDRNGGYSSIEEYEENRPDGPLPDTLRSSTVVAASTCSTSIRLTGSRAARESGCAASMSSPVAAM